MFLEKYVGLDMYDEDMEKRFIIDHEKIQFDKNYGLSLIVIPEKPDVYLLDHEYFCINNDIFDRIQSTCQDNNIILKCIYNEPNENGSQCGVIEIYDYNTQKNNRTINKKSTKHNHQRKRQRISVDYRKNHLMN